SPIWTTGKVNGALQFNATDNGNDSDDPRVTIGTKFDINVPFTFAAWVNPADYTDWRAIFSKRDSYANGQLRLDIGLQQSSGQVYVIGLNTLFFAYAPPTNTWTHLAVVASTTDTTLYVNGVFQQTLGRLNPGNNSGANTVIGGTGEPIATGDN